MSNDYLVKDSKIQHAWQLFLQTGQLQREAISDHVAVQWERAKLLGIDARCDSLSLTINHAQLPALHFTPSMTQYLATHQLSALLVDSDHTIHSVCANDHVMNQFHPRQRLTESTTANISVYHATKTMMPARVVGSEHYLQLLQGYGDISYPITIGKRTFLLVLFVRLVDFTELTMSHLYDIAHQWQLQWHQLSNINSTSAKDTRTSEVIQLSIDNHGVIQRSSDEAVYAIDDNIYLLLADFNIEQLQLTDLITCTLLSQNKSINCLLLNCHGNVYDLAIYPSATGLRMLRTIDLFKPNVVTGHQHHIKPRLEQLANQPQPVLVLSNNWSAITKAIRQLVTSRSSSQLLIVADLSITNIQANLASIKWYRDLSNCTIVISHIELLDHAEQLQVYGLLDQVNQQLQDKQVAIIMTAVVQGIDDQRLADRLKNRYQLTTYLCFDVDSQTANRQFFDALAPMTLAQLERQAIERAIALCHGNLTKAAESLAIGRTTLYRKIEKYQLNKQKVSK